MKNQIIWTKSYNPPPTNHIWLKADINEEILGVYIFRNGTWTLLPDSHTEGCVQLSYDAGVVYATDENGEQIVLPYSVDPVADTLALRSSDGNVKTGEPVEENDSVPASCLCWVDV